MALHPVPTVWLFDLDGTLVDTAPELTDALNAALAERGLPPCGEDLVRGWIGDGARALWGKALAHLGHMGQLGQLGHMGHAGYPGYPAPGAAPPALEAMAEAGWPAFAQHCQRLCGTRSRLHAGVRPMLQRLRAAGARLAVLTNKEAALAQRVLAAHGLDTAVDLVLAGDSLPVKKPHPAMVAHTLARLQAAPGQAVLVGDSVLDLRCARAAGIAVWLVRHGYPAGDLTADGGPDRWISHFDEVVPTAVGPVGSGAGRSAGVSAEPCADCRADRLASHRPAA